MANITQHRPALAWLTDLQKAKFEGAVGIKPKVTIQDLLERINDPTAPEQALIPSSPRSVEACFRLGIDPVDLQYHAPDWYKRKEDADEEVSRLRYERNESVRQERLRVLMDGRKHLIDEGWSAPAEVGRPATSPSKGNLKREDSNQGASSAMVEKERQRLEVLKRRQERELQQMVAHEHARKELLEKQQQKMEELEARTKELQRIRQQHEFERMNKQREIELQKAAEERENERRARVLAEERYQHEKKMQAEKAEHERQIKKKAYQDEMERRRKADEARKETEAILAAQAEEVRQRKLEMEKRDAERKKRMIQEAAALQAANLEKRKKAEQRITGALEQNMELLRRKRMAFEQKEAEAERRRREAEEFHQKEERLRQEEELRKQQERQHKYQSAMQIAEQRKNSIQQHAQDKDRALAALYTHRRKEHDLKKVEQEFQLKLRLDKVDSIQKTSLYQRHRLLERIMGDYERTRSLMRERQSLQEQRKMANMHASLQRQAIAEAMDKLKFTKNVAQLNINDLLAKTRPATAF